MANIYVRSTDGSDADNGSTWALAKATLTGAAAIDAAGDTIYVSQAHAEITASAVNLALAGTDAAPVKIIAGDDAAEPPTTVSVAAAISTTGASSISIGGACYVYGLIIAAGSATNTASLNLAQTLGGVTQEFESCSFRLGGSNSASRIAMGASSLKPQLVRLRNTSVRFSGAAQGFSGGGANLEWLGGSVESGGTSPTTALFRNGAASNRVTSCWSVSGVNLENIGTSCPLFEFGTNATKAVIRNCKLPASWSGALTTGTSSSSDRVEMYNCDSGDTNYRMWVEDYNGSVKSETAVLRGSGASDGATSLSWVMSSSANAEYPLLTLNTPEIVQWNDTTGSAITATIEIVTDNVTLTDGECWIEVQYLGTSGYPLGAFASDAKADVLATAANQTSSSVAWTTTGLGTPVKQKLSVTFTPQEKGFIHAVVKLAKASATVYVDPLLTIT